MSIFSFFSGLLSDTGLCGAPLRAMRILALEFLSKNEKRSRKRRGAKCPRKGHTACGELFFGAVSVNQGLGKEPGFIKPVSPNNYDKNLGLTKFRFEQDLVVLWTEKKFATGLCVPFVDISLRASFYSASHFSTEIRAREFAWP